MNDREKNEADEHRDKKNLCKALSTPKFAPPPFEHNACINKQEISVVE